MALESGKSAQYCKRVLEQAFPDISNNPNKRTRRTTPLYYRLLRDAICTLAPAQLHDAPDERTSATFASWKNKQLHSRVRRSTFLRLHGALLHEKLQLLLREEKTNCADDTLFQRIVAAARERHDEPNGLRLAQAKRCEYLKRALRELRGIAPESDWGALPLHRASFFVWYKTKVPYIRRLRALMLQHVGCQHSESSLLAEMGAVDEQYVDFKRCMEGMGNARTKAEDFEVYLELASKLPGGWQGLGGSSAQQCGSALADVVAGGYKPRVAFKMLAHELSQRHTDADAVLRELKMSCDIAVSGLTNEAKFRLFSSFHEQVADAVRQHFVQSVARRSHFEVSVVAGLSASFRDLVKLHQHALQAHPEQDGLRWFLGNCTRQMLVDFAIRLVDEVQVNNDAVKRRNSEHQGVWPTRNLLRLLRQPLAPFLTGVSQSELASLQVSEVTDACENKRRNLEPGTRREMTDAEFERLYSFAVSAQDKLLLTILREIGLRVSALRFLQWKHVLHDGQARDICYVPEKLKQYREFATSLNLKSHIHRTWESFRALHTDVQPEDAAGMYVFNFTTPSRPVHVSCIHSKLQDLVRCAKITGVKVHPHMFRHTIVGALIKAGNDIALVSKFMGHQNTQTTEASYWVTTLADINKQLKNPFGDDYEPVCDSGGEKSDLHLRLELKTEQLREATDIIHQIIGVIKACARAGAPATDVLPRVFDIEDIEKRLELIAESVSNTMDAASEA